MKTSRLGWFAACLVITVVAGGTFSGTLAGASTGSEDRVRAHVLDPTESTTRPLRLFRRAQPMTNSVDRPPPRPAPLSREVVEARTHSVPARPPDASLGRASARAFVSSRQPNLKSFVQYRRYEIQNTTAYPFVTHGKLVVVFGANEYHCSATIVSSANESTLATAAHCLYSPEEGDWADAMYFAPGYRLGNFPFGVWEAESAWVPTRWITSAREGDSDFRYDVGFLYMPPAAGATLMDAFGSRGISFNRARTSFSSFGYPAAPPFDGERLFTCESSPGGVDVYWVAPEPNAMGCDMTGGSSGGGWIASGTTFVNSVTSYGYEGEPDTAYGPYFGAVAQAVYHEAEAYGTVPAPPSPTPSPTAAPPTPTPAPTPAPDTLAPYIDDVADGPDPFSPNGDGVKDKTRIDFSVSETIPYGSVEIYRGYGLVRSLAEGALDPGGWFVKWAGRNDAGQKVKNGTYTYVIRVEDEAGNVREVTGYTTVKR